MSQLKRSNPAGWLASLFVTSRMTSLVILACALLGAFAIRNTPREENPQIVVPAANIYLSMPGATAVEMERLLVQPLEGIVKQIISVDHVYASISDSSALVSVQFKVGADKGDSLVALYDALAGHRDRLPDGARDPVVRSMDVDNVPVVTLTLASDRYDEFALKQLGDRMIDHLRGIGDVSSAYVQGGLDREVRIELDPAKLAAYQLTWDQLRELLRAANVSADLGTWVEDTQQHKVLLRGSFTLAAELEGLVVGTWEQRLIYLDDVATIRNGPAEYRTRLSRFAFGPGDPSFNQQHNPEMPAVTLALAKKRGVNAVLMADQVLQRVEEMKASFIATTLATFSIMTAFLAQLVPDGVIGQYFYPVAFNVPVAIFFSLLIAYTVTPWAAHRWLKPAHSGESHPPQTSGWLARFYVRLLDPVLDNRALQVLTFGVLSGVILLSCLQPAWQFFRPAGVSGPQSLLGVEIAMLPKDNKNTFNITIDLPEGSPIEQTDQVAREVGDLLRTQAEVTNYQIWLGQGGVVDFNGMLRGAVDKVGPHVAEIRVNLTDKSQRDLSSILLVRDLRPAVLAIQERHPGSRVYLIEDPPGPPVRATVLAEIYGENLDTLEALGEQVASEFRQTPDVVEVHTSTPHVQPAKVIEVDRDKAVLAGVSTAQVAQLMERALSGEEVGRVHVAGERQAVPIYLAVPRAKAIDLDTLPHLNLRNPQGQDIPLSSVAHVSTTLGDRTIFRKDYQRVVYVAAETGQSAALYAVLDINRRLHTLQSPDGLPVVTEAFKFKHGEPNTVSGYHILWDGEMRLTLDAYGDMLYSFGLAILFIYLLLVAHYQSFAIPLIAMSAIPLGLIGVFPGHWLVGQSFTATSMIGFIALAGVVVRNSLLIIDFVLDQGRHEGSLKAAVLEATSLRLRPILLTAAAVILASAVMIPDPIFGGLAISLIFGTLGSTFLTVLVVPLLLYLFLAKRATGSASGSTSEETS